MSIQAYIIIIAKIAIALFVRQLWLSIFLLTKRHILIAISKCQFHTKIFNDIKIRKFIVSLLSLL